MTNNYRKRTSKIAWGFFWLLLAGLIIATHFGGFVTLSIWSIALASIAAVVLFSCIINLSFAFMPIPLAALYAILGPTLGFPDVPFWTLLVPVTLLVTIALHIMLPRRFGRGRYIYVNYGNKKGRDKGRVYTNYGASNTQTVHNVNSVHVKNGEVIIDGEVVEPNEDAAKSGGDAAKQNGDYEETTDKTKIEEGDDANNPYISVSFGYASRYLHSDNLESAELNCNFGGMEVYFDNVTLSPNGAEVNINCSFGSVEVYVPSHWRVIDDLNSSLANAEVSRKLRSNDADAPTIRVTGSVSLGNVEVKRIKGD